MPDPDQDRPAPRAPRPDPMQEPTDSYDAAMRAADALFSRPAAPTPDPADPDAAQAPVTDKNGGRILRALEEPPDPEMAALEARYAETRRGRKPGSKNKPKPPVAAKEGAAAAPPAKRGRPRKAPVAIATIPAIATISALPNAAPIALAETKPRGPQKRGAWQGGRAKLGEAWKRRRLPPACW